MEVFKFEKERKILGERVSESRGAEGKREMETEGKYGFMTGKLLESFRQWPNRS